MNAHEEAQTTLYGLLKRVARQSPHSKATDFMGGLATYSELLTKVDLAAMGFSLQGVGAGDHVAICAPNCPQAIVALYALNKIGAVAVLLNPLSPPQQVLNQMRETGCKGLVILDLIAPSLLTALAQATRSESSGLKPGQIQFIVYAGLAQEMGIRSAIGYMVLASVRLVSATFRLRLLRSPLGSRLLSWSQLLHSTYTGQVSNTANHGNEAFDPAVVIYSGGTTGEPKPVVHSSYAINYSAIQCLSTEPPVTEGTSMLAVLPHFHIFGLVVSLHLTFVAGAKCILVPRFRPENVANIIVRQRPTYMAGVPTIYEALLRSRTLAQAEQTGVLDLSGFRVGFCGGDTISPSVLNRFNDLIRRNRGSGRIVDGYGLTEMCPITVMPRDGSGPEGSIGRPLPGVSVCIVSPGTTDPLPPGQEGEICVSGGAVMSGYLNSPAATSKSIILHPGGRPWLHTGDVGYLDSSGYLFFTQRLRQIIKVSGNTVYLVEVESVLHSHPAVVRACAVAINDNGLQQKVKAFVVLKNHRVEGHRSTDTDQPMSNRAENRTRQDILEHCRQRLLPWAVPVDIEFRGSLPVNLLGKVSWGRLEPPQ